MNPKIKLTDEIEIEIDTPLPNEVSEEIVTIGLLINYFHCFLNGCAFPGNTRQTMLVLEQMFTKDYGVKVQDSKISFKMPQGLQNQFLFKEDYCLDLTRNAVSDFYLQELAPKGKLACKISVHASGSQERQVISQIQKILLETNEHLKTITILYKDGRYITTILSRLDSVEDRTLNPCKTLTEAVTKLEKRLSKN
ncbi:MAG: hypothetical protein ABFQ53_00425 [Patescibacteria group bacterium]